MRLALELADAGLLALPEEGEAAAPSPGLAIVDNETIIVGREAAARARLTPRRLHSRFWLDISTELLGRPFGRHLRSADLAWTHLAELWKEVGRGVTSVILALSGDRSKAQLGLILGVARSAGLPVDGMVDSAVAGALGQDLTEPVLHLDLELHRAVLTLLDPGPTQRGVVTSDRVGLAGLRDAWLRLIAGAFLKATRFDPFHSAASEQDLYDRLSSILETLGRRSSTTFSLRAENRSFSIDLTRDQVVAATELRFAEIDELVRSAMTHRPAALLLTARAASAPGLADRLADLTQLEVVRLPLAAAAAGAHQAAPKILTRGPALPFTTDLSGSVTGPVVAAPQASAPALQRPTHVLAGGVAHPLGSEPLWLGSAPAAGDLGVVVGADDDSIRDRHCVIRAGDDRVSVEDLSGGGCTLNDQPMGSESTLNTGDRLRLGAPGVEVVALRVEN